jgi:VIT1/CCC1 family predicted Fe2+/Mn2+ transporter
MHQAKNHREHHLNDRIGWLRAAVLGANDGIVSIASLVMGVATAGLPIVIVATAMPAQLTLWVSFSSNYTKRYWQA